MKRNLHAAEYEDEANRLIEEGKLALKEGERKEADALFGLARTYAVLAVGKAIAEVGEGASSQAPTCPVA